MSFEAIYPFQKAATELRLLAKFVTATEKATVLGGFSILNHCWNA